MYLWILFPPYIPTLYIGISPSGCAHVGIGIHPCLSPEDTEDEAPRPPVPLIPDPLDEILKRHVALVGWLVGSWVSGGNRKSQRVLVLGK